MREKIKPGSPSLFFLIQILNICFGVSALILIGLSIWLWTQFNTFSIIIIVFMGLGVFEFLLVLLVISAKRSVAKLRCFLFFMAILFLAELVSVIIIGALGDDIVKKIAEDSDQMIDRLKDYLNIIIIYAGCCLVIMALEILSVRCYIGSLRQTNNEFDYKFVDGSGGKLTIEQKQTRDKKQINQKYNKKRQQLANKYPGYQPTYS